MKSGDSAKWNYCFLFFISNILLSGCNLFNTDDKSQTIIKGYIRFPVNDKVYFYGYANTVDKYLAKKTALDSTKLDDKGNYSLTLKWNKPDLFELKNGNTVLVSNFFLSPGDKLTIDFNEQQRKPGISQNGEAAIRNQFIISYIDTFYEKPIAKHLYYIGSNYLSPGEFTFYIEDRKQKQLAFYKKYFKDETPDKAFDDLMISEITYQSSVDKLMYAWKKRMKGESKLIQSTYYSFLNPALIENPNALSSPAYIRFLNLYIKDVYERMIEYGELPLNKSEKIISSIEKFKIAEKELKKPFSDIVLYNIIYDDMNYSGEQELLSNFSNTPIDTLTKWLYNKYPSAALQVSLK